MERIGGAGSAEIFREGRLHDFPMRAAISSKKNGASAANDPAHLIGGGGAGEQVDKDAARLALVEKPELSAQIIEAIMAKRAAVPVATA